MCSGIFAPDLLEKAETNEIISLCPSGIARLLGSARDSEGGISPAAIREIAVECLDFHAISNDPRKVQLILQLIKRFCDDDGASVAERIADFLGTSPAGMTEQSALATLAAAPVKLLRFLKRNEGRSDAHTDKQQPDESQHDGAFERYIDPEQGLRGYQIDAARRLSAELSAHPRCVMYHAPTGSGKTRTAMSVVTLHIRNNAPTGVLWLAASSELVNQAADAFEKSWRQHGDIRCILRAWHGDSPAFKPEFHPKASSFTVAGLQKVALAMKNDGDLAEKLAKKISLIVFDEAHQSVAPTFRAIVEGIRSRAETCAILGLSATPGRRDEDDTDDLVAMFGGKKVTIQVPGGNVNPIAYLEREGYLARARFIAIPYQNTTNTDLGEIARSSEIAVLVANAIQNDGHRRVLVFSPTLDSAKLSAAFLKKSHKIKHSFVISAATDKVLRKDIIDCYSGRIPPVEPCVIFNYGILTTGFDAPKTSAVIIARPTSSVGLYSQMVGRGLRGPKSGGNEKADIYTFADVAEGGEFTNVAKSFSFWNNQWRNPTND